MAKFSASNQKIILIASHIFFLLLLTFLTIQYNITYNSIFFLIIPIVISIFLFENRIYLILFALMLFAYALSANHAGLEYNDLTVDLIVLTVCILFTSEFIIWNKKRSVQKIISLVKSSKKFESLYEFAKIMADTSPDLFWAKDIRGNYLYANKAMYVKLLCAVNSREPIGKTPLFFAERERKKNPENKNWYTFGSRFDESETVIIKEGITQRYEQSGCVKGEKLVLDIYKAPLRNMDGDIIGIMGTARDITKVKETEEKKLKAKTELKLSEQKYRNLVENLNEIIYTSDGNGHVTYLNNAFEKITGFPNDIFNKMSEKELIHPDDYEKFMGEIAKVKQNHKVENFEYRAKTALGDYRHFLTTIQPLISINGKFAGLTGVATDITKIKEAEKKILDSKKKLDTILSAIPDLILIFDAEGNYLDAFPQDSKYLVLSFAELKSKNIRDVLPRAIVSESMTIINKAISTNRIVDYKYTLIIDDRDILFNARVRRIVYDGQVAVLWNAHDITTEEKIMKALKENEKKFLNLLNYTYDWEYWVDVDGNIGYTSPSCKAQTGYEPEEYLERSELLADIVHPADKKIFLAHLKEVCKSNSPGKIQFKILKKNGEMRVIRHTCQAVFDNGKYIGRRVTNRNATDRWNAEQQQIKSEKKYKSIFDSLIDVYYRLSLDGIVENVSPSIEKISGYKRHDIIGKNASTFYLIPELRQELLKITLKEGVLQNYEIEMRDKTGEVKTISFNNKLVYDESGMPIAVEGMLRDVTQSKKAREELLNAKNEIQNYLSIARVMILVLDQNGIVKLINKKGCKILGYNEDEIMGKNWLDVFIPQNQRKEIKNILDMIMKGKVEKIRVHENEIINKSGSLRTIRWNNAYLENTNGEITGILSSGEDITDEKKMLHNLIESEKNLKELNSAKDKFFSIVSHDIRSPFTALLGFTQILDEDFDSLAKEEIEEIAHSLNKISKNIFEFIEGLLEWSRVQSNKIEINLVKLKLFALVQDVFVLLSAVALKKGVRIKIEVAKDLEVLADENVVETVLRNLISNAIKFSYKGDTITIYTENSDDEIIVCVKDTGTGINEEIKNKLFKLDEYISELGTEKEKGTGLGLLLCRDLLEKQQNKIWVDSVLNKGSIFKFTLKKVNSEKCE